MSESICSIPGCGDFAKKRDPFGYCHTHYRHQRDHGNPYVGEFRPYRRFTTEQRFWYYVQKTETCWLWTGPVRSKKSHYGRFQIGNKKVAAHRYSYELHVGPIPEGLYLDHICHNPPCVNPDHLRPVTSKQNQENQLGLRSDNTSGFRGVCASDGGYRGTVHHCGQRITVGWFATAEEAGEAVRAKRLELYTHNDEDRFHAQWYDTP